MQLSFIATVILTVAIVGLGVFLYALFLSGVYRANRYPPKR